MRRGYAALVLLALIWGASFLFIKLAVRDMSPATLVLARALFGALTLGAGGSGIAYLLYYYMMNTLGATRATTVTFLLPLTAVFWGATLLHEAITIPIVAGMVVILLGVYLTSRPRGRRAATVVEGRGAA